MSRKVLSSLFFTLALVGPLSAQDVFVPRELKAEAAHSPGKEVAKPKEGVRRAEPATQVESKAPAKQPTVVTQPAAAKPDVPVVKADKALASKDKPAVSAPTKTEKAAAVADPQPKKIAKADSTKAKTKKSAPAEKKVSKTEPS